MTKITKAIDWLTMWTMEWAKYVNAILMLLITYEVFMRYFVNKPTIWGLDLQTFISAVGRMIGIGYAEMLHSHATVDVITIRLSKKKQKVLELIGYLGFFFPVIGALTWAQWFDTLFSWKTHEKINTSWRPPVYHVKTMVVGCYILLLLQGLAEVIKDFKIVFGKEAASG
jgi:TRAP-type mannitol/chloroaromatic compound transport system permease small subunit